MSYIYEKLYMSAKFWHQDVRVNHLQKITRTFLFKKVKTWTSTWHLAPTQVKKVSSICSSLRVRLPSSYRPPSYSFLTGKYPAGSWRHAARSVFSDTKTKPVLSPCRTRFRSPMYKWTVTSKFRGFQTRFNTWRKQFYWEGGEGQVDTLNVLP